MNMLVDLKNKRYGNWVILERDVNDKWGMARWICECKCGKRKTIRSTQITSGRAAKQCGCENDWTGKKFGRLTVIRKLSGFGNHAAKHLCSCECGGEKIAWGGSLYQGSLKSCGCIRYRSEEEICMTVLVNQYERRAKKLNKPFFLKKEEILRLLKSPCYYCGDEHSNNFRRQTKLGNVRSMKYNGIDRVDNKKGYILENCVACCKKCNLMKSEMSVNDWINHIRNIIIYLEKKELAEAIKNSHNTQMTTNI